MPVLLRHALSAYGSAMRRALEAEGYDDIPKNGLYVIGGLAQGNGAHPLSSLIAELDLSKQAAGQLVDTLVTRGYLHRNVDPTDRRKLNVGLTERGRAAATVAGQARVKVDSELLARVAPHDVEQARRMLLALIEVGRASRSLEVSLTPLNVIPKRAVMDIKGTRDSLHADDANLSESRFTNVRLANSYFEDVNLQGSTFTDVNLAGAKFANVSLANVVIKDAGLKGMSINGILVADLFMAYNTRARIVLYAKNLALVQAFYEGVIGLELLSGRPDHVTLVSKRLELTIVQIPESIAATLDIAVPPQRRSGTPIKLVFEVASLGAARDSARGLGGDVDPAAREWSSEGWRVCDGLDPEGNVVQFRQREI